MCKMIYYTTLMRRIGKISNSPTCINIGNILGKLKSGLPIQQISDIKEEKYQWDQWDQEKYQYNT